MTFAPHRHRVSPLPLPRPAPFPDHLPHFQVDRQTQPPCRGHLRVSCRSPGAEGEAFHDFPNLPWLGPRRGWGSQSRQDQGRKQAQQEKEIGKVTSQRLQEEQSLGKVCRTQQGCTYSLVRVFLDLSPRQRHGYCSRCKGERAWCHHSDADLPKMLGCFLQDTEAHHPGKNWCKKLL